MENTMRKLTQNLTDKIIESVVKQAAFSLGVSISLMFIPVLGQAIAGLMAVTQALLGKKYDKDTKRVIEDAIKDIERRAQENEKIIMNTGRAITLEEMPQIRALAMSDQPLSGLHGIGSSFKKFVKKAGDVVTDAAKGVSSVLAKAEDKVKEQASKLEDQAKVIVKDPNAQLKFITTLSPIGLARLGIKYTASGVKEVAKGIESTNIIKEGTLTKPISQAQQHVDENLTTTQKMTSPLGVPEAVRVGTKITGKITADVLEATGNEGAAEEVRRTSSIMQQGASMAQYAMTPTGAYNLMSGRETYITAKREAERMRAVAFAELDALKNKAVTMLKSPEGKQRIITEGAKALREDPSFIAFKAQMDALELQKQQEQAQMMQQADLKLAELEKGAQPATKAGAGTAIGIAAAVAAAYAFS